jgi:hypothetical protein
MTFSLRFGFLRIRQNMKFEIEFGSFDVGEFLRAGPGPDRGRGRQGELIWNLGFGI